MADAKITYNSSVIAELNGGQTATLKCKGKKMDDDVTVESLGGSGTDERFKQLVEGTLTEINDSEIETIRANAFMYLDTLEMAYIPNVTTILKQAFFDCGSLASFSALNVHSVSSQAFYGCRKLKEIKFPKLNSMEAQAFQYCTELEKVDVGNVNRVQTQAFTNCNSLKAVIMRNTEEMTTLRATSVFDYCYHFLGTVNSTYNPEGLKDGYFYVPRKWLSDEDETIDYRRATNWTTLATQFRALEDYTVDGTTTGELDWEKVNAA